MKISVGIALIAMLGMLSASHGAITIHAVGDGSGYDILGDGAGNEAHAYRSTDVAKTFDADGDNVYGTAGVFMFGNGVATNINSQPFTTHQQIDTGWTEFTAGAQWSSVAQDNTQGPMDDLMLPVGAAVADRGSVGFATVPAGGAGNWGEILEFAITASTPQKFRIGLCAGTQSATNHRWDPTGLRITDGGSTIYASVTGLEGSAVYGAPNWVFFDVDLGGATSGILGVDGQQRLSNQGAGLTGIAFDEIVLPDSATLSLSSNLISLELVAPDSSVEGTITATYTGGQVTSGDIQILSYTADAGFSAVINDTTLGTTDKTEDIVVTFDNTLIGLQNGESTNSTLEVVWTESGSSVINTSYVTLNVTYINEPNGFELTPASLALTLKYPDTSTNGTLVASYVEGTIPADIEIISIGVTNGFSVDPDRFTLGSANPDVNILVTYDNAGALVKHGDTADSVVVVTWTETGSGVTNTANGAVRLFYYNPTVSTSVVAGYDFDDGTGTATTDVTVKDANATASAYGVGAGLISVISANGNALFEELDAENNLFGTTNGISFGTSSDAFGYTKMNNEDNLALAMTNEDYMVFTVTPVNDYVMDLTSFTFRARINQLVSSAERWALFSSVDGFATTNDAIATGQTTVLSTYVNNVVDLSAAKFQRLEGAVEFRLYIYGGSEGYSSATLFDKVIVNGSVYRISIPPVTASISDGSLIMSWENGRSYNVLTNVDLVYGQWGVAKPGVSSPVTNAISGAPQVFYKLGE